MPGAYSSLNISKSFPCVLKHDRIALDVWAFSDDDAFDLEFFPGLEHVSPVHV